MADAGPESRSAGTADRCSCVLYPPACGVTDKIVGVHVRVEVPGEGAKRLLVAFRIRREPVVSRRLLQPARVQGLVPLVVDGAVALLEEQRPILVLHDEPLMEAPGGIVRVDVHLADADAVVALLGQSAETQVGSQGWKLLKTWQPCGYLPVKRLAREATHTGDVTKHSVNAVPSRARRSRLGVCIHGAPSAPMVSARCWSVMMRMMFGRLIRAFISARSWRRRMTGGPRLQLAELQLAKLVRTLGQGLVALGKQPLPQIRILQNLRNTLIDLIDDRSRRLCRSEQAEPCGSDNVVARSFTVGTLRQSLCPGRSAGGQDAEACLARYGTERLEYD